jgi:UDP-N-acetylmuramoyl-L-alanyl-D-glutamate--2,6-diaminopimelate ligase
MGTRRQHVVIVGGGFAGLNAARALRDAPVDVTIVDRRNHHLFQPLLYQVATGALSPGEIAYPLRSVFKGSRQVRVLLGEVDAVDLERRHVRYVPPLGDVGARELAYDTLIVAGGSRHSYFGHDAWEDHAPGLKSIEDAVTLRSRILRAFEAAEVESDADRRRAWLTFVVVGAGPTGVEMAGQIAEIAHDTLARDYRSANPADARIILLDAGPQVLPDFAESLRRHAGQALRGLGVEARTGTAVTGVDAGGVTVATGAEGSERIDARTVVWAGRGRRLAARAPAGGGGRRRGRPCRTTAVGPDLTVPGHPDGLCGRRHGARARPPGQARCPAWRRSRCSKGPTRVVRSLAAVQGLPSGARSATSTRARWPRSAGQGDRRHQGRQGLGLPGLGALAARAPDVPDRLPEPAARPAALGVQLRDPRPRLADHHGRRGALWALIPSGRGGADDRAAGYASSVLLLDDLTCAPAQGVLVNAPATVEVRDLVHDTRDVRPGALFVCVPGARRDGHDLAGAAVEAGAVALVVERPLDLPVPQLVVPSTRRAMAPLADVFFGLPTRDLRVAGVTGTNGKTTTAFVLHAILTAAGLPTGLLGTVERRVGGVAEPVERTTPEAIELQRSFRRMVDAGDVACVMEVSSHALELHRVDAVRFAAAVFTNLSQDHLDFHPSMEAYFAAKAKLFDGRCPRAVNGDDAWGRRLEAELRYGREAQPPADVRAEAVRLDADGTGFRLVTPVGERDVRTPLRGGFNVSNALAAAAGALLLDVDLDAVVEGLRSVRGVPGRMEPVEAGQPFTVIVDYAHTPDALRTVLETARGLTGGRLRVVFGAGGDRDREKRPLMGAAAAQLADDVVVTSDNPRGEDPEAIVAEIMAGIDRPVTVELDRRAAIARALADADPGDVVVIAGKGHEQGQETGGVTHPFDDRLVARELLA